MQAQLMPDVQKGAIFSDDRRHRYLLWRIWDHTRPLAVFIGLNSSKANELEDDPTVRRVAGFTRLWGYGGFYMMNIFAFCATDPKDMFAVVDPEGAYNDSYLKMYVPVADTAVAAWGVHGTYKGRGDHVAGLFPGELWCLGTTKSGQPRHPLYLRSDTPLVRYAA